MDYEGIVNMNKRIKKKKLRSVSNMTHTINQNTSTLQMKLDYICSKASVLKANKDIIQLDQSNAKHVEWYEIDKYKGE